MHPHQPSFVFNTEIEASSSNGWTPPQMTNSNHIHLHRKLIPIAQTHEPSADSLGHILLRAPVKQTLPCSLFPHLHSSTLFIHSSFDFVFSIPFTFCYLNIQSCIFHYQFEISEIWTWDLSDSVTPVSVRETRYPDQILDIPFYNPTNPQET